MGSVTSGYRASGGVWGKARRNSKSMLKICFNVKNLNFTLFREKIFSVAISEGNMTPCPPLPYAPGRKVNTSLNGLDAAP